MSRRSSLNRTGVDWSDPESVAAYKRQSDRHHEYNREYQKAHYVPSGRPPSDRNQARGEAHGRAKLTYEQVRAIRRRHASGTSISDLAREYGLGVMTVSAVVNHKTWKDVE